MFYYSKKKYYLNEADQKFSPHALRITLLLNKSIAKYFPIKNRFICMNCKVQKSIKIFCGARDNVNERYIICNGYGGIIWHRNI